MNTRQSGHCIWCIHINLHMYFIFFNNNVCDLYVIEKTFTFLLQFMKIQITYLTLMKHGVVRMISLCSEYFLNYQTVYIVLFVCETLKPLTPIKSLQERNCTINLNQTVISDV